MKHDNYISINNYRSSTNKGFDNTWQVFRCSRKDRQSLLTEGLPCPDIRNSDGTPIYSTIGIRASTQSEIRKYKKNRNKYGVGYHIERTGNPEWEWSRTIW